MKSLIISAAVAVSTLFAGAALADEPNREVSRPSVQSARTGQGVDAADRFAQKLRERGDQNGRATAGSSKVLERKIDKVRPRGDMVEEKGKALKTERSTNSDKTTRTSKNVQNKVDKRGDVERRNPNQRRFTVANDRNNRSEHAGPRTIVDIMRRKETLKFLSGAGIKINCSQTSTCVEEVTM